MSGQGGETRIAQSYRLHRRGIDVDGARFPWIVSAEPGPMVEPIDGTTDMHILWLPVIVDAVLPPTKETL